MALGKAVAASTALAAAALPSATAATAVAACRSEAREPAWKFEASATVCRSGNRGVAAASSSSSSGNSRRRSSILRCRWWSRVDLLRNGSVRWWRPAEGRGGEGQRAVVMVRAVGDYPMAPLPFDLGALSPNLSKEALSQHYDGHYRAVLADLNGQLNAAAAAAIEEEEGEGAEEVGGGVAAGVGGGSQGEDAMMLKRLPLHELIRTAYNNGNPLPCFNSAAEAWNHDFFFTALSPNGGGAKLREIERQIEQEGGRGEGTTAVYGGSQGALREVAELLRRDFGGVDGFEEQFRAACELQFGSGWVWLSAKVETLLPQEWLRDMQVPSPYRLCVARLIIEKTSNALNPLVFDRIPLLGLDMWEHAYLSDYAGRKGDYVDAFLNHLVSWDAVAARVVDAKAVANFFEMPTPRDSLLRPGFIGDRPIDVDVADAEGEQVPEIAQ